MKKLIVIALGGNALGVSSVSMRERLHKTVTSICSLIKDDTKVLITHGNGPQVGFIHKKLGNEDLSVCTAMSQGYIGSELVLALQNELKSKSINRTVTCMMSTAIVSKNDSSFLSPSKPIGEFYDLETIQSLGVPFIEDALRGYREVVPSPTPVDVLEIDTISKLLDDNHIVIAGGGGGIPVVCENNAFTFVNAVVDKDYTSSLIASRLNANELIILTSVKNVCINYKKENEQALQEISTKKLESLIESNHFAKGSMLEKVNACLRFLSLNHSATAVITSLDNACDYLSGTVIRYE